MANIVHNWSIWCLSIYAYCLNELKRLFVKQLLKPLIVSAIGAKHPMFTASTTGKKKTIIILAYNVWLDVTCRAG